MALQRPPQKGLPRFRYRDEEEELRDARVSVRRWWWEYLRLSKDYWLVSQTHGRTLDRRLYEIWRKFGDVHNISFDAWWLKRGAYLFREQTEPPKVEVIRADLSNLKTLDESRLVIDIPLILRKATIQRQIGKLLAQAEYDRPRNVLETSKSEFPINPVAYRLQVLQKMHQVWCEHRELILKPKYLGVDTTGDKQRSDLFQLGKKLGISPSNALLSNDHDEQIRRNNRMRATVSRYIRRANQLIQNVEHGNFPVFRDISKSIHDRFTDKHRDAHKELEQQWWNMDLRAKLADNVL